MSMFCYQCQETARNTGCTVRGVCGKQADTSNLMDVLIYVLKGISIWHGKAKKLMLEDDKSGLFVSQALFATITNANFDDDRILALIDEGIQIRNSLREAVEKTCKSKTACEVGFEECGQDNHDCATWTPVNKEQILEKATEVGVLSTEDEDVRSLREMIIYGVKGIAAYADHAAMLGFTDQEIWDFVMEALAATTKDLSADELVAIVMKTGEKAVQTMALLDKANTETYGHPEITEVNIGVGNKPGILISGHDLHDMYDLLEQTKDTGIDVYTHSEMLPANYYPAFKKYDHFHGNYGNAWWKQNEEFESFNGPILMTTNCTIPLKDSYKNRFFTTGMAGYPGAKHIADRPEGGKKDFSEIIELAKKCPPPKEIETGKIIGGFAHNQVLALADKVIDAVKSGAVKRFIVMAGCDGRHKTRSYFTDIANELPKDAIILTAGCAKYRYNKLNLGDIGGIPRVLDAGQCNDSYSLAVIALKLKEVFELDDINDLPISFDIAWYEQKAVAVLLALLYLGVKKIHLGPTLPGFLSPNIAKVLVEMFDIRPTGSVKEDVEILMSGK